MGQVSITYQILPGDTDTDVQQIADAAKSISEQEGLKVRGYQIVDIAFGIKGVLINIIMPDQGDISEKIEKLFAKIPKVESVEVYDQTLI